MRRIEKIVVLLSLITLFYTLLELDMFRLSEKPHQPAFEENYCGLPCVKSSRELGLYLNELLARPNLFNQTGREFDEAVQVLQTEFLIERPVGTLIRWERKVDVQANDLSDDTQIIAALRKGSAKYKKPVYEELAWTLIQGLEQDQLKNGVYAEFFDAEKEQASYAVELSSLTPETLLYLKQTEQTKAILGWADQADDSVFFPESYHLEFQRYQPAYDVYMEEQLLIAINRKKMGFLSPEFDHWLVNEWKVKNKMPAHYIRITEQPSDGEEKVVVYLYLAEYFHLLKKSDEAAEVMAYAEKLTKERELTYTEYMFWNRLQEVM